MKQASLPTFFKPIFWSYDFPQLDPEADKQTIILQAINYGDLEHWHWILQHYGKRLIRQVIETVSITELRPHVRKLAFLIFSPRFLHDAPRSAHAPRPGAV